MKFFFFERPEQILGKGCLCSFGADRQIWVPGAPEDDVIRVEAGTGEGEWKDGRTEGFRELSRRRIVLLRPGTDFGKFRWCGQSLFTLPPRMKALFAGLHLLAAMDFAATGNASELRYVENGDLPLLTEEEAAKWKKE